ncbi:MAG: hypothetical protein ABR555_20025, partial [Pyrinomonadaceae bacterium]
HHRRDEEVEGRVPARVVGECLGGCSHQVFSVGMSVPDLTIKGRLLLQNASPASDRTAFSALALAKAK